MPLDDSAEPLEESADILRGFRRRAADYLRGRSAEFVKLLLTRTVYGMVHNKGNVNSLIYSYHFLVKS